MRKRVLITDDELFMRLTLRTMLEKNGYEIAGEAADGRQAVELYRQCKPDLVTMDITMPEMTGIEAMEKIIQLDPQAVIVMVSAMGQKKLLARALKIGAKDFLIKPFDEDKLLETLRRSILKSKKL